MVTHSQPNQDPNKSSDEIEQIARERFGYDTLLPGQAEAVQSLVDGLDTLVVLPTGAGKSAIYQIAGIMLGGPVVVISPLIALQQDQVASIEQHDVGDAAALNSALRAGERREALAGLDGDELAFLFLAPEQFQNAETLERLRESGVGLLVVDEAHCIVEWGHDFRPDYLRLGAVIEELGHPRVLALTATASPPVREEIIERLQFCSPRTIVRGFDRPNIWLSVRRFDDEPSKYEALIEAVTESDKPGIVYAATRKHVESIASALSEQGTSVVAYHGGMSRDEREAAQSTFMDGEAEVIVATNAFGMGIDKPNVRFVFHADIPGSLDSYYQEIGRAGRDGKTATAILFYRPEDLSLHHFFAGGGSIEPEQIEDVDDAVEGHPGPMDLEDVKEETDLSGKKVEAALADLEVVGAVTRLANGDVVEEEIPEHLDPVVAEAVEIDQARRNHQQSRIEMMRHYAEDHECRRNYLLSYFGEPTQGPCGNCDNCDAGAASAATPGPFAIESAVRHATWGDGVVLGYEGDTLTVRFESEGYKTLDLATVLDEGLLQPVESGSD